MSNRDLLFSLALGIWSWRKWLIPLLLHVCQWDASACHVSDLTGRWWVLEVKLLQTPLYSVSSSVSQYSLVSLLPSPPPSFSLPPSSLPPSVPLCGTGLGRHWSSYSTQWLTVLWGRLRPQLQHSFQTHQLHFCAGMLQSEVEHVWLGIDFGPISWLKSLFCLWGI